MATLNNLTPGQRLYKLSQHRLTGTHLMTTLVHTIRVVAVDKTSIQARVNDGPIEKFFPISAGRWLAGKPTLRKTAPGRMRLAQLEEIERAKKHGMIREWVDYFLIEDAE